VGIELAQIIPGIAELTDFDGLLGLIAPRPCLVVSAEEDPYSFDAPSAVASAHLEYERLGSGDALVHRHYPGGHPLTEERVEAILRWLAALASDEPPADDQ
jgi:hypothetical protein